MYSNSRLKSKGEVVSPCFIEFIIVYSLEMNRLSRTLLLDIFEQVYMRLTRLTHHSISLETKPDRASSTKLARLPWSSNLAMKRVKISRRSYHKQQSY